MNADLSIARWFKSSHSGGSQDCVEVAFLAQGMVGVRDSKNPTGPALVLAADEWDNFAATVASGGLDGYPTA